MKAMTDNAREHIAERMIAHMRRVNKSYLTATPQEIANTSYLCGVEETLLWLDVPCRTVWDADSRRYTSLTLDGVTFPVPDE